MRQQTRPLKDPAEKVVQDIRRAAREHILFNESGGCSGAGEVAGEARPAKAKALRRRPRAGGRVL